MRILHVSQPTTAGVARVVRQAVDYQSRCGHDVAVASPEGELAVSVRDEGFAWFHWDARREPGPSIVAETWHLRQIVARFRPDIVHLHASKAGFAGRLSVGRGTRVIFQPHSWSFEAVDGVIGSASRRWEQWAQRRTDATLWCSWGEQTVGLLAGVRATGVVAMNGVDLIHYRPATSETRLAARARLGLPPGAPVAVVVGRLAPQKGQDLAIRAWPRVRASFPDAQLVLLGDGPDAAMLKSLAGEGVTLLGDGLRPSLIYQSADVAILPSRWEGMSLVMIEGMASGLPTVATDVSGAREALTAGATAKAGAVIPTNDVDAIAAAVRERFGDSFLRVREGAAARIRAERQFASESAMETMVSTYSLITSLGVPRQHRRRVAPPAIALPQDRGNVIPLPRAPQVRSGSNIDLGNDEPRTLGRPG